MLIINFLSQHKKTLTSIYFYVNFHDQVIFFLKDMNDFKGMNVVYAERFSDGVKPAR